MKLFHLMTAIYLITLCSTQVIPNPPIQILPVNSQYYGASNAAINTALNTIVHDINNTLSMYFQCSPDDDRALAPQTGPTSPTGPTTSCGQSDQKRNLQQNQSPKQYATKSICGCPNSMMRYSPIQIHDTYGGGISMDYKRQLRQMLIQFTTILNVYKTALANQQINNIVIGNSNTVIGNNITLIGFNDTVTGQNIFIWGSNDNIQNGSNLLVIQNYVIFLDNVDQIMSNPYAVINCVSNYEAHNIYATLWKHAPPRGRLWLS